MFFSKDSNHERSWWYYVGRVTVVQVLLIILCFIVRIVGEVIVNTLSADGFLLALLMIFLYLPGYIVIVGGESIHMSAPAVWILLLFSVAFYSVLFGTLFYSWHQYILMLRSMGSDRPHKPVSEPEPETRDEQGKTSTAIQEGDQEELSDTVAEESAEVRDEAEMSAESEIPADLPKNRGMLWLRCVIGVTAVQPFLLLLCFVAPDSILAAGIMTYFYIPARLLVDGFNLPAPVVLILFLLSVVFFSVFFGTVVCFGGPLVKRMPYWASAFKRRVQDRQSKKCSNSEYDGGVKWGCCVSVLIVLQPLLIVYGLFYLDNGGLGSLFKKYVYKPAEWLLLLPLPRSDYAADMRLLPVLLFLLLAAGTFYSVLFGSLFYWLYRKSYSLFKSLSRKVAGK